MTSHPKQWNQIANLIGTRTILQVRTHAQKWFASTKMEGNLNLKKRKWADDYLESDYLQADTGNTRPALFLTLSGQPLEQNELWTPRHTGLGIDSASIPVPELVASGTSATTHGVDPTPDRTCCLDISKQTPVGSFATLFNMCASGPTPKPSHMEAAQMLVALGK
jgi:hypothetical protein